MIVSRRVDERTRSRECAIERGPHAAVRRAGRILAGDPALAGDGVRGADQGQGNPQPRLDLPKGEDMVLPPEVPAVRPAALERMVGHHDHGAPAGRAEGGARSEEHTSELQSRLHLVCRLLLEKKKTHDTPGTPPTT